MTDFQMDWDRISRTGTAEAVLCDGKSTQQIDAILAHARSLDRRLLLTRLAPERYEALPLRDTLDYDDVSRTAILGALPAPRHPARIAIVSGGTSDLPVALEAARTLA